MIQDKELTYNCSGGLSEPIFGEVKFIYRGIHTDVEKEDDIHAFLYLCHVVNVFKQQSLPITLKSQRNGSLCTVHFTVLTRISSKHFFLYFGNFLSEFCIFFAKMRFAKESENRADFCKKQNQNMH